jgi:hypothetical protein
MVQPHIGRNPGEKCTYSAFCVWIQELHGC